MIWRTTRSCLVVLSLLIVASAALAKDVVRLRSGRSIHGRILAESAEEVTVELFTGGRVTIPRSLVTEILRDVKEASPEEEVPTTGLLRSEHYFLWSGERRLGARSLFVRRLEDGGLHLEEDSLFLDEEGREDARIRVVEKVSASFEPREIIYRETSKGAVLLLQGRVRGDELIVTVSYPGTRRQTTLELPEGRRFPLSAREEAVRAGEGLETGMGMPVFDPREEGLSWFRFENAGKRRVAWEGAAVEVLVLRRTRGGRDAEEIWLDPAGRCLTEELNGSAVVAVLSTRERVEAFRSGSDVTASAEEERVRPLVVVPEAGFTLRKPSIAWKVDRPPTGERKVLSLSNLRTFAYVDVFVFPRAPEGRLLTSLAVEFEERLRAVSKNFRKVSEGYRELGGRRAYQMVATSTNKGEALRSLVVGTLHEGKSWLITLACPEAYFERARAEFEAILGSFKFLK